MRLITFAVAGEIRVGLVAADDRIIDLTTRTGYTSMRTLLEAGLDAVPDVGPTGDLELSSVQLLPPVPDPVHIIGVGLNTHSHFAETLSLPGRSHEKPKHPRLFMRSPLSHVGDGSEIVVPRVSSQLDYEGELAVVIGKPMRYVAAEEVLNHVAGYSCYNDGSIRDYQFHTNQSTAGKNFPASGAFGPWLTTTNEAPPLEEFTLTTSVNGEVRQRSDHADLIFSVPQLVSYLSEIYALQPGDVVLTGSGAGIGALTGSWLVPGDTVEVAINGVGTLTNTVRDE
jgi:2-keto-4-pentenoate hydratase/2-oxohepta-3-ene-1,7-dioic acid hydratase in catechol pathway